jgi:hypothetical protein
MKTQSVLLALAALWVPFVGQNAQAVDSCQFLFASSSQVSGAQELPGWILDAKLPSQSESHAFTREGVALEGIFKPQLRRKQGKIAIYEPTGKPVIYGGVPYVEFPNSTALSTTNSAGKIREFILTRGVKPYITKINEANGAIQPRGYVSDVLLFERVAGNTIFRSRILASVEGKNFFFEDPRISVIYKDGRAVYFLSGTDYSPHVEGSLNLDVMNRYVELKVNDDGLPLDIAVNPESGKPDFRNMSPEPIRTSEGYTYVDAKNGTIAVNELGQIVVRTRLRPDFDSSYIKSLAGSQKWKYAEQIFVFSDWSHFQSYNWNDSLIDLFHKRGQFPTSSAEAPLEAKTILRDGDLKEKLHSDSSDVAINAKKGKGFGPGTRPLRVRREGDKILISEAPGAPEFLAGTIPADRIDHFIVKDSDVIYITFDHEIRFLKQKSHGFSFSRRHYSASIKFFDSTLEHMIGYHADVIQPVTDLERGQDSGILDLQHVYPMGWTLQVSHADAAKVRVYDHVRFRYREVTA